MTTVRPARQRPINLQQIQLRQYPTVGDKALWLALTRCLEAELDMLKHKLAVASNVLHVFDELQIVCGASSARSPPAAWRSSRTRGIKQLYSGGRSLSLFERLIAGSKNSRSRPNVNPIAAASRIAPIPSWSERLLQTGW